MATSPNTVPRRRGPNPAGRVDLFAANLLERAVSLHGDLVVRAVYGTFKGEINRAIKGQLRGIRIQVPEMLRYPATVPVAAAPPERPRTKPAPKGPKPTGVLSEVMDMRVGPDGVYEVSDAQ